MSELLQQIKDDQLAARKSRDALKSKSLTTLIGEASPSGNETVDDTKVMNVVQKFVKNLKEVIGLREKQGSDTTEEHQELAILSEYLPKQFDADELQTMVEQFVAEKNINSPKQMGQVMGHFSKTYKGQFDGKVLSAIVNKALSS